MPSERAGRPGVTWDTGISRNEVVVPDGPWAADKGGPAEGDSGPNRETRRADARARRKRQR